MSGTDARATAAINAGRTVLIGRAARRRRLTQSWPEAALGYARLTGFHMLGVERATNTLVVLVEATTLSGQTVGLPHHCLRIPDDVHREYAPSTNLRRDREPESGRAVAGPAPVSD